GGKLIMTSIYWGRYFIFEEGRRSNSKVSLHIGESVSGRVGLVKGKDRGNGAFCVLKKAGSFTFTP
ncbi:hypothetical protein, partial [Staphylococcus aureus]|uniref:hypothetical protein n=1 Tax=Staphylococcus aureus TaxID=1280 RepID=UPI0006E4DC20